MPDLTIIHFGLLALMLLIGAGLGWILRGDRCAKEKIAVSASWQDQLESQQSEHNRLAEQNKSLMEQISQYQASQKDYSNRAKDLSDSLKEAFTRRDELQRQVKDVRGKLEVAVAQRNQLRDQNAKGQATAVKEKDDKIFRLSRELTSWQNRVPPLVQRYQDRDQEARELEDELGRVRTRLHALEELARSDHTRIEPLDADSLPDGGDASNEPIAMTSIDDGATIQDQIEGDAETDDAFVDEASLSESDSFAVDDSVLAAVFDDPEEDTPSKSNGSALGNGFAISAPNDDNAVHATPEALAEDDLQKIKGIGPTIEKTLHELGIHRFHQIAEMSEVDIDRVAQQLRGFRSRIYREDWIGQARDLQHLKNSEEV